MSRSMGQLWFRLAAPPAIMSALVAARALGSGSLFVALLKDLRRVRAMGLRSGRGPKGPGPGPCRSGISSAGRRLRAAATKIGVGNLQYRRNPGRPFCTVPFEKLIVNCDGSVQCGSAILSPIVGSVEDETLPSIWTGTRMAAIRRSITAGSVDLCGSCPIHGMDLMHLRREQVADGPPEFPPIVWIEPTALCNIDCPQSCGSGTPGEVSVVRRRREPSMRMDTFRKALAGIDPRTRTLAFLNYGEPLLHSGIFEMIALARAALPDTFIYLDSNGVMLSSDAVADAVAESGLDEIRLSIDGADRRSLSIYRSGADFDSIMKGVRRITSRPKAGRPSVLWQYILFFWNDSREELARAVRIAEETGFDKFAFQLSGIPLSGSWRFRPTGMAFRSIRPFMLDQRRFRYGAEMTLLRQDEQNLYLGLENTGDIPWNAEAIPWGRTVDLSVRRSGCATVLRPGRFLRIPLGRSLAPGESLSIAIAKGTLPDPAELVFDLAYSDEFYFSERGAGPLVLRRTPGGDWVDAGGGSRTGSTRGSPRNPA